MKVKIDLFKDKVWTKNINRKLLNKKIIEKLLNECFLKTNTNAVIVFLNVSCVDNQKMIEYNKKYRNKNQTTNVLSFELNKNNNKSSKYGLKHNLLILGDMVLCYEKIRDEAEEYNKTFKERLYHLIVHSILHLLGYDHIDDDERENMEKLEIDILEKFGIKNIYLY